MPKLPTWEDVKKVADDLEEKVKSAGASAREKWNTQLRPKLAEVQKKIEATGQRAGEAVQTQVSALSDALAKFGHEIREDLKIGKKKDEAAAASTDATTPPADAPAEQKPDDPKPA